MFTLTLATFVVEIGWLGTAVGGGGVAGIGDAATAAAAATGAASANMKFLNLKNIDAVFRRVRNVEQSFVS